MLPVFPRFPGFFLFALPHPLSVPAPLVSFSAAEEWFSGVFSSFHENFMITGSPLGIKRPYSPRSSRFPENAASPGLCPEGWLPFFGLTFPDFHDMIHEMF